MLARERGVRIGQWKKRDGGRMREREEMGGYDQRTARRVINNRAAAPALCSRLPLSLASFLFLRFVSTAVSLLSSSLPPPFHGCEHRLRPLTGRAKRRLTAL